MKRTSLIFILMSLLMSVPAVMAADSDPALMGVEKGSLEWKRAEVENFIADHAMRSMNGIYKPDQLKIRAHVEFKDPKKFRKTITEVNVSLLGTVAVLESGASNRDANGLLDKVESVKLTLVVANGISDDTATTIARLAKESVPVISPNRIQTEIVKLDPPQLTFAELLKEFKNVLGWLAFGILCLITLRFTLPRIRFQTAIKIGPAQAPSASPQVEVLPFGKLHNSMMIPLEVLSEDKPAEGPFSVNVNPSQGDELLNSLLPQTLSAMELRRLRSLALTLSIKDCLDLIRSDAHLGSVLVNLLPTEKTTSLLSQLPQSDLEKLKSATLDWTAESLAKDSAELMDAIKKFRTVEPQPMQNDRLNVFVEQVGPDQESGIFSELIQREEFEKLASLARQTLPAELMPRMPLEILRAAYNRLNFKEKARLLVCCDKELAARLLPGKSGEPVHAALRLEIDRIRGDEKESVRAQAAWPKFVSNVRAALQANPQWSAMVHPIVENWLWEVSQGLVGSSQNAGARGGNRGDAA